MRKTKFSLACGAAVLVLAALLALGPAFPAGAESWDISGPWLIEGVGFAEKDFVRVSANLEGNGHFYTVASGDVWCVTSYDLDIKLTVTGFGISAWKDHLEETLHDRVPLPEMHPTVSEPFDKLPAVTTENGLTYRIVFTSATSGTVTVTGFPDVDVAGTIEVNSESAIWRKGTTKPAIDTSKDSGCGVRSWGLAGLLAILPFLFGRFRVK